MNLQQHPLSAAFPSMTAEDFEAMKADIKANGQREPIIVHEGMVLDGWHRFQACTALGIEPNRVTFAADADPVAFVLSTNLHRRHLTASQRAAAVVSCSEWAPASRPKKGAPGTPFLTKAELATKANVSESTIAQAKVAHKAGLTDMVKEGALTVKEAAKVARSDTAKAKPAKKEKRTLEQPDAAQDKGDQLAEAKDTIAQLAAENESLNDRLAVEAMDASEDEKTAAADTIADLRHQVKVLEAELSAVKASRDTHMRENNELKSQIKAMQRAAKKAEQAAA